MGIFSKNNGKKPENAMPQHIAIIMDGNGRWAKKRGLPRHAGHVAGAKTFKEIARHCNQLGVRYLTVYAFSTENWRRPQQEVDGIMDLLREYLRDASNFKSENMKLKFIGDFTPLAQDIRELITADEAGSADATGLQVNIALNYGGRDELVHAVRRLIDEGVPADQIDEKAIADHLYTADMPDPELLIRPSGEYRLSNFLVWQSAYTEYYFCDRLWPDFSAKDLDRALEEFWRRDRRFGGVKS